MNKRKAGMALAWLGAFILWTLLVRFVDVQPIGPLESTVGLASINGAFHQFTGVHLSLYNLTDWLSLIPLGIVAGFGLQGLVQWIRRGCLTKVDFSLLMLGGFYVVVMGVFVLFEVLVINYRPILIEGVLEGSYPSSTTMLVMCIMPTAVMRCKRKWLAFFLTAFAVFMVVARLLSGVHWLTDIIGGAILSVSLVGLYDAFISE